MDEVCPTESAIAAFLTSLLLLTPTFVLTESSITLGYARHFLSLKKFLAKQPFANDIEIVGIKDPGLTGNFEITIGDDKEMIHSAKTAGQGKAESDKEREMIVEFIQEYLDDQ